MAHLIATHIGFGNDVLIQAKNSYAQEFLTDQLGLKGTSATVNQMVCCSTHAAAQVINDAIAEGFTVGFSEPQGRAHGSGKL